MNEASGKVLVTGGAGFIGSHVCEGMVAPWRGGRGGADPPDCGRMVDFIRKSFP